MSQEQDRPLGKLFTEVYRERGAPVPDSKRFRVQLEGVLDLLLEKSRASEIALRDYLKRNAGTRIPGPPGYPDFGRFVSSCSTDDLLDFITHVARFLDGATGDRWSATWINRVQVAFDAQNLAYEIDPKGGVHHRIDAAFAKSKALTVACLTGSNFSAAHEEIEKAFDFLTAIPADNKMAVVNVFLAAENVFKIVVGKDRNLAKDAVKSYLKPHVQRFYSGHADATKQASLRLMETFAQWADACHAYRHGQDDMDAVVPPDEIAISLVTTGADFIRWLVELSKAAPKSKAEQARPATAEAALGDTLSALAVVQSASEDEPQPDDGERP